jgi:hypothetical protein
MHYTIYKITNKINNKFYIGKHKTANLDDDYMGSGKYLSHSIKKYGVDNFVKEIMFVFDNELEMNAKEKELVSKEFCLREDTYNLCEGGQGGFSYINQNKLNFGDSHKQSSLENLKKGRNARSNKLLNDPVYRQEQINLMSESKKRYYVTHDGAFTGKTHSEETKKKLGAVTSSAQSGSGNSQYGSKWITDGNINNNKKD